LEVEAVAAMADSLDCRADVALAAIKDDAMELAAAGGTPSFGF
jgi:hypothetical protein